MLAVGGSNMGSVPFSLVVSSESNRKKFIENVIIFLRKHNFDGLDICWIFPTNGKNKLEEKERFGDLLKVSQRLLKILTK